MLERYFQIEQFLDRDDPEIKNIYPDYREKIVLKDLLAQLQVLNDVTLELQLPSLDLSHARTLFEETLMLFPEMRLHLDQEANIVECPEFEAAVVKVLQ